MKYLIWIYWDESAADFSPESMVPWEEYHAALTTRGGAARSKCGR